MHACMDSQFTTMNNNEDNMHSQVTAMKNNETNNSRPWSDLLPELLTFISQRLRTQVCVHRFRSVCRTWRDSCSFPLSSRNKKNILSPIFPYVDIYKGSHDCFIPSTILLIEPKDDNTNLSSDHKYWILSFDEFLPGSLSLMFPLTNDRVIFPYNYPKYKNFNLLDFRVTELVRSCSYSSPERLTWNEEGCKVVLFPEHDTPFRGNDFDFKAAIVRKNRYLSVYDSSLKGNKWKDMYMAVDDVVNYKGRLFAFNTIKITYALDYETLKLVRVAGYFASPPAERKWLVVSDNGLYLVTKDVRVEHLRTFKLNEEAGRWVAVSNLENQVFFVGQNGSYSFSAQNYHRFRRNCIYIFGKYNESGYDLRGPHSSTKGVFKLRGRGGDNIWPPPLWIKESTIKDE